MKLKNSKKKRLIKAANNFEPWDYAFLLDLEYESLKLMDKYYSTMTDLVDIADYKYVKIAIKLLDIVLERDTSMYFSHSEPFTFIDKYINTRNGKRFFPTLINFSSPSLKEALRIEKAWYLYSLLRFYKLRHFWI